MEDLRFICRDTIVARIDLGNLLNGGDKGDFSPLIMFKSGSPELSEGAKRSLDSIFTYLSGNQLKYLVVVHSDKMGPQSGLQKLSEKRAEAIVAYLVELGIDETRLYGFGAGSRCYIGSDNSAEDQRKNRRVEFLMQDG